MASIVHKHTTRSKKALASPPGVAPKRPTESVEGPSKKRHVEVENHETGDQEFETVVDVYAGYAKAAKDAMDALGDKGTSSRWSFDPPEDFEPTLTDSMSIVIPSLEKQRIWAGHYIDLHGFLPQIDGPQRHTEVGLVDGKLVSKQGAKNIRSVEEWTTAFLNFKMAYCEAHVSKYRDLTVYMKIVRYIAHNFEGFGWRTYDICFRMAMGANPTKSWAHVDQELWCLYVTKSTHRPKDSFPGKMAGNGKGNRFRQGGKARGLPRPAGKRDTASNSPICSFYSKGSCKFGTSCSRPHKCIKCGDNHPASKCTGAR